MSIKLVLVAACALIDADGRIVARWDNVATRQEIEPLLQDLPAGR